MKQPLLKIVIRTFFFSGLIFAGLMAGSDYSDGIDFRPWNFIFNALFFGGLIALMAAYKHKKKMKKKDNNNNNNNNK